LHFNISNYLIKKKHEQFVTILIYFLCLFTGLDTFEDHPEDASDYLYPLLKYAAQNIPQKLHKETLLYILATAGMRLLSEE